MKNLTTLFSMLFSVEHCSQFSNGVSAPLNFASHLLVLIAGVFGAFAGNVLADDWRQFRGENRDGKAEVIRISDNWNKQPPKLTKTLDGAGDGYASLCVVDDIVYTTGNSDTEQFVVALQISTGKALWRTAIVPVVPNHDYLGSRSTPTYDEKTKRLFVVGSDGRLVCLNLKGKIIWQRQFQKEWNGRLMSGWGFSESPLVDGDQVVVTPGGRQALMVALKTVGKKEGSSGLETAVEVWRCKPEAIEKPLTNSSRERLRFGASYSSMIIAKLHDVKQYVQLTGDRIISVDPETGKVFWQNSSSVNRIANICSPVQVGDNQIFYSTSHNGGSTLLDIEIRRKVDSFRFVVKPRKNWPAQQMQSHHGGIIVEDDHVFFAHGMNRGFPMCVDLSESEVKWGGKFRGPGIGSASLLYCDGKIIFRYQDGIVALIEANPNRYRFLGKFMQSEKSLNRSWAHPVISNGNLLLREGDKVMVYDLSR